MARSASSRRTRRGGESVAVTFASSVNADVVTRFPPPGLAPLGHRNYALYWIGQLVSMSGTCIEITAISLLLYTMTYSPFHYCLIIGFSTVSHVGLTTSYG